MGKEFEGEKAFSRMMSTLFVILVYSSGMPILYMIGFVFYVVTYFIHKMLIINYYQKSRTLTRTIPLFSVEFLKLGLIVHIFGAFYMLTNPKPFKSNADSGLNDQMEFDPAETMSSMEEGIGSDNLIKESLYDRLKLFHQKVYIIFLLSYAASYATGKTVYGLIIIGLKALWKMTRVLLGFLQTQFRELRKKMGKEPHQEPENDLDDNDVVNDIDKLVDGSNPSINESSESSSDANLDEEEKAQKQ